MGTRCYRYCCVESCSNRESNCDLPFFMVPRNDPVKADKWLKGIKLKPNSMHIKKKHICSDHFETKCYTSTLRKHLLPSAIPTLQFKAPKKEVIDENLTSHVMQNSMDSISNFESLVEVKKEPEEMCVVASLVIATDNSLPTKVKSETELPGFNTCNISSAEVGKEVDESNDDTYMYYKNLFENREAGKRAIEQTIDTYLRKRYLSQINERTVNLLYGKTPKKKLLSQSVKENRDFNSSQQTKTLTNNQSSSNQLANSLAKSCNSSSQQMILSRDHSSSNSQQILPPDHPIRTSQSQSDPKVRTSVKQSNSSISVLNNKNIQAGNVAKLAGNHQQFTPQSFPSRPEEISQESSEDNVQKCTSALKEVFEAKESFKLKFDFILGTDRDCDRFAQNIAEELKQMKNLSCRARTQFNIQRILFEAQSGFYD